MPDAVYVRQTWIAATPDEVFAFHESPGALERLTPPWEPVDVVHSDGSLRPGSRVVLRMRLGPFRREWIARHDEYEPPHLFSDRQESGPFASWHHRHRFEAAPAGGTWLIDEIQYRLPGGRLGHIVGGWLVRRKLERMFAYRHEVTRQMFEDHREGLGIVADDPKNDGDPLSKNRVD